MSFMLQIYLFIMTYAKKCLCSAYFLYSVQAKYFTIKNYKIDKNKAVSQHLPMLLAAIFLPFQRF